MFDIFHYTYGMDYQNSMMYCIFLHTHNIK